MSKRTLRNPLATPTTSRTATTRAKSGRNAQSTSPTKTPDQSATAAPYQSAAAAAIPHGTMPMAGTTPIHTSKQVTQSAHAISPGAMSQLLQAVNTLTEAIQNRTNLNEKDTDMNPETRTSTGRGKGRGRGKGPMQKGGAYKGGTHKGGKNKGKSKGKGKGAKGQVQPRYDATNT